MTAAFRISQELFNPLRCKARARVMRAVFWALLWASLAHANLLAFKLAQVRLQPDAIATGIPGFLFRLVIRPLEVLFNAFQSADPAVLTLQIAMMMAISAASVGLPLQWARSLGGQRAPGMSRASQPVPGRRETPWN